MTEAVADTTATTVPEGTADIGVTGLAVMGANLARNFAKHGYTVALHNRTQKRTDDLVAEHGDDGDFVPTRTVEELVSSLKRPRRVLIMVKAGSPVDAVIEELVPFLEEGDIIIDGGNSLFTDTRRREAALREQGIHFVGVGVSGGEEGALNGPSIMPGGSKQSYESLGPMLESIAAEYEGVPCCSWIGPDGAGHFVKMVHNGIEYSDMQVIGESYDILRNLGGKSPAEQSEIFAEWNKTSLESYLIEITSEVLAQVDADTGKPLVDVIKDAAGQKGTGRWTSINALELGSPITAITESVFARGISSLTDQRKEAQGLLSAGTLEATADDALVEDVRQALYATKLVSYAQGLDMLVTAAKEYDWPLDITSIASLWRAGCIIRAALLNDIMQAYEADAPSNLLFAPSFTEAIGEVLPAWRRTVGRATAAGIPVPSMSSALAYYDALRAERLPAALIQGQRDLFGAHTYERTDKPGVFHTEWFGDKSEIEV